MSNNEASNAYQMSSECSLAASLSVAVISGVGCNPPSALVVVVVVAVVPRSPPLPILVIHPVLTMDTPVNVFNVAAIINVALFPGMRSALLLVIIVVVVVVAALRSLPSPVPGICPTRTPDMPVDVFVITAVVDITLFPRSGIARPRQRMACPAPPPPPPMPVVEQHVRVSVWHVLLLSPHVIVLVVVSTAAGPTTTAQRVKGSGHF